MLFLFGNTDSDLSGSHSDPARVYYDPSDLINVASVQPDPRALQQFQKVPEASSIRSVPLLHLVGGTARAAGSYNRRALLPPADKFCSCSLTGHPEPLPSGLSCCQEPAASLALLRFPLPQD